MAVVVALLSLEAPWWRLLGIAMLLVVLSSVTVWWGKRLEGEHGCGSILNGTMTEVVGMEL